MHVEHSCFISYPHLQNSLVERVVLELHQAVSDELQLYNAPPAYFDRHDLEIGENFAKTLAKALYNSASMVLIFVPAFFSERNLHGAQELLAMERLEKQRLKHLPKARSRGGLIVPVTLRGSTKLSPFFSNRQHIDFSDFMLFDQKLSNNPVYAPKIQEIARYVYECYREMSSLPEAYGGDSHGFTFPSLDETREWLKNVSSPAQPFPFQFRKS